MSSYSRSFSTKDAFYFRHELLFFLILLPFPTEKQEESAGIPFTVFCLPAELAAD